MQPSDQRKLRPLEQVSTSAKDFYSAGSTFSTIACAATSLVVWTTLAHLWKPFDTEYGGLIVSFLIVFAYALVLPEPPGYPNEGKLRLTLAEVIFGILNTFIVFSAMLALKKL